MCWHRKGQLALEGEGKVSLVVKVNLSWEFDEIRFVFRNLLRRIARALLVVLPRLRTASGRPPLHNLNKILLYS